MEKSTYLTFLLGKEYFAVNVCYVLEVLQHQSITPVPKTPAHILGIINFRGDILPVIDTRQKLNLALAQTEKKPIVIVFDVAADEQTLTIAATADAVKDVIEIESSEIKSVPEMGLSYNAKLIDGAIRRHDEFIMLLNIAKVFSMGDMEAVDNICIETNLSK